MAQLYLRPGIEHIEDKLVKELSDADKGRILTAAAQLKKTDIYMMKDFANGMAEGFIPLLMQELNLLKAQNSAVLYLTDDVLLASRIGDSAGSLRVPSIPGILKG
ncbi:MAG: hypothetical protein GY765_31225 [bacterium]|nr:hypothetical protein [bacterium]